MQGRSQVLSLEDEKYIFRGKIFLFLWYAYDKLYKKILGTTKFVEAQKIWGGFPQMPHPWLRTCLHA